MPTTNTIAVRVALENAQQTIKALRDLGPAGEAAFQQLTVGARRTSEALEQIPAAAGRSSQGFRQFGEFARQAGFQAGDFAVQVQGGTNAIIALSQQGSQLAGFFGPIGALIGAAGAALGAFAVYAGQAGDEAETAREQLDELLQSTDQYRQLLEDIAPLQAAYLTGLVKQQQESDRTAAKQEQINKRLQESLPVFTGGRLAVPNYDEVIRQTEGLLPGGSNLSETERLLQQLRRNREREDRAINEFLNRNKPGIIENARFKPPYETSDEFKEAQEEAKKLAEARDQAAKAAEREAVARERIIERADFEAQSAKRLADANEISAEARDQAAKQIDAERRILEASNTLSGEELEIVRQLNEERAVAEQRILATNEARKAENELIEDNKRFIERIAKDAERRDEQAAQKAKREAERQADILAQPFKDLVGQISGTMSDGIQQALDGDYDLTNFADTFADVIGTAVSGVLGSVITAPLNQLVTQTFNAALDPTSPGFAATLGRIASTPTGGTLLAGGAGYIGGSIYGQATGNNSPYTGLGGSLGAAGGYALGTAFPVFGPATPFVGGAIGGLLGSTVGGLFGSENNLGNDRSGQVYRSGQGVVYSDRSFSPENRSITSTILGEIETLEEAFHGLGGVINAFTLRVEAGNKSGITVDGKRYDTAEEALSAAIGKLIGKTTGLSAVQQTILANTKAGSAAEIGADLAFGQTYEDLIFQGTEADRVLRDLGKTFAAAGQQAAELGLDVQALADAHAREAAEVQRQQSQAQRGIAEQIAIARGDQSLGTQFHILETQMRELAAAAANLNIPLSEVTRAHEIAAQRLAAAYDQQLRGISEQIAAARGDRSLGTQLHVLETQMRQLAQAAAAVSIPLEHVYEAHRIAAQELVRQNDQLVRSTSEQIAATRGDRSLGTQLHVLETQMRELAKAAADAQIPLEHVYDAHRLAAEELRRQFSQRQRGVAEQIAAARGDDSLVTQLHVLETQMRELAKAASEVGIPLSEVTQAHEQAAQRLRDNVVKQLRDAEQQLADAQRGAFGTIDQYLDPLKQATGAFGIGQGVYSSQATTQSGIAEFRRQLALAQGGDIAALQGLAGTGQSTLQAARAFGASGPEFAAIFREVNKGLLETQGVLEEKRLELIRQGLTYQRETLDEQIRTRVEVVQELRLLRDELAQSLFFGRERAA